MNTAISDFDKCHILVVGDMMLDEYVWGKVDRISPEAPVQIVSVQKEDHTLGGAGNVVNNLASLGATVSAAGVIGDRSDGDRLIEKFKVLGLDTRGIIRETDRLTTRKTRIIAAHQHVLRIDRETVKEISEQTLESVMAFAEEKIPQADLVLISDYGKGLVTKPLLEKLVAAAQKHGKMTIADPKGLDFSKYAGVSLLTPNKKEATLAAGLDTITRSTVLEAGEKLLQTTAIGRLIITCGKDGMVLFKREKPPHMIRAVARQVFDVSGAGDTVLSVIGLALASGMSHEVAATVANAAAGIVVGKVGTATISQAELTEALKAYPDPVSETSGKGRS